MITVIRVPATEDLPLAVMTMADGNLVGDRSIDLNRPSARLWHMDQDAGLPVNHRASLLWKVHTSAFNLQEELTGEVLLSGPPNSDGVTGSVPDELVELLMDTERYTAEVQISTDGRWYGNKRFSTWVDAYTYALDIARRWLLVRHARVVPAPDNESEDAT